MFLHPTTARHQPHDDCDPTMTLTRRRKQELRRWAVYGASILLVAFVVLSASNLWSLPYQFASYLAF